MKIKVQKFKKIQETITQIATKYGMINALISKDDFFVIVNRYLNDYKISEKHLSSYEDKLSCLSDDELIMFAYGEEEDMDFVTEQHKLEDVSNFLNTMFFNH